MRLPSTDNTISRVRRPPALLAAILALAGAVTLGLATHHAEGAPPKNVVFILTDDQTAGELAVMPNTQALIGGQGTTFRRAYVSYPLCCPARATLLSGQYMHNHGVRGNLPPFGGWENFKRHESNALPVWTHDSGYYNVHIGKYMNGWGPSAADPAPVPNGWDEWYGKVSEGSVYFNYNLLEKTGPSEAPEVKFYGDRAERLPDGQLQREGQGLHRRPRQLTGAVHDERLVQRPAWALRAGPASPVHALRDGPARLPGFNEKNISDKPRWLRKQARKRLGKRVKRTIANERLRREEQLLSVDEAVRRIVDELRDEGLLDDTYIIFASDNGFFRGEHRIIGGKYLPYDPSSKVPLMIRGPGIPAGGVSDELVSLTDVPQTILDIAGSPDSSLDGRSLLPYAQDPGARSARPILSRPTPARAAATWGPSRPRRRASRAAPPPRPGSPAGRASRTSTRRRIRSSR